MPTLRCLLPVLLCALSMTTGHAVGHESAPHAKHLFGAKRAPAVMPPESVGSYTKGCLAGGMELPDFNRLMVCSRNFCVMSPFNAVQA